MLPGPLAGLLAQPAPTIPLVAGVVVPAAAPRVAAGAWLEAEFGALGPLGPQAATVKVIASAAAAVPARSPSRADSGFVTAARTVGGQWRKVTRAD